MPKITSTPTASSERTRLCAPVMPVAGSAAAAATERAAVSTPASAAAASLRRRPRGGCSLGVVVISAFSWALLGVRVGRARATKNPSCHRHGGVSASVGDRRARRLRGCGGSRRRAGRRGAPAHCAPRPAGTSTNLSHHVDSRVHFCTPGRGVEHGRVEGRRAPRRSSARAIGRPKQPALEEAAAHVLQRGAAARRSRRPRRRRPCPSARPSSMTRGHQRGAARSRSMSAMNSRSIFRMSTGSRAR